MPYKRSYKTRRYRRRRAARTRKRRYLARRRRARALSYRRRRRKYNRVARINNIYSRRKLVSLRWYGTIHNAVLGTKYVISANNPRDPTTVGGGHWVHIDHQAYGWDQMVFGGSGPYKTYCCIGSKVKVRLARNGFVTGSSKPADANTLVDGNGDIDIAAIDPHRYEPYPICGYIEDNTETAHLPSSFQEVVEFPHVKYKVMNARQQSKVLTMKWGYKREASIGILSDNRWSSDVNSDPDETRQYAFFYQQYGSSNLADQPVDLHVTVDYLVLFSDPHVFEPSNL